jgi:hypothetical protein
MNKKILFVGIDPAPKESGISLLLYGQKKIKTFCFTTETKYGSFANWYLRVSDITSQMLSVILNVGADETVIVQEFPPPRGIFSPALYGLGYVLLDRLRDVSVVLAPPVKIHSLMGRRASKTAAQELLFAITKLNNLEIDMNITSHESDASILLLWGLFNIVGDLQLPQDDVHNVSIQRWKWRISKVDLKNHMKNKNVKLFNYLGSEDNASKRTKTGKTRKKS